MGEACCALILWEKFEAEYGAQLSEEMDAPAKSFRMALGALIIKERLGTSDAETVEQLRENHQIEGKFGQGKRRFSLGRVMAKLAATAECTIAITFLVMNLERWLHHLLLVFFVVMFALLWLLEPDKHQQQPHSCPLATIQ